jgi:hypothetical protein
MSCKRKNEHVRNVEIEGRALTRDKWRGFAVGRPS